MKIVNKSLGILLVISMIFSVFSVMASALAPDSAIDLYLDADKASYSKGDVVTFTVSEQTIAEVGAMYIGGQYAVAYDSNIFEPISTLDTLAAHNVVAIADGLDTGNSMVVTPYPSTIEASNNWDAAIMFVMVDNSVDLDCTTKTDLFTFQLRVKDDAPDGDYFVGFNKDGYVDYTTYSADAANGGIYGWDDDNGFGTTTNYGLNGVTIHVGAPAAASILKYSKAQIRFKGITATSGPSTYEGTFDVRTVAKISQADFLATFTSEENAKAKITDFGFVYAAKSKVASFDLATAKAVAEGAKVENYVKAPVTYMQHTGDGADYIFTCLITPIPDADKTDGVNCLAYVCFDGTYIYFDAAESVSYNSLYTAHMPVA